MASRARSSSPLSVPSSKRARIESHEVCGLLEVPEHISLKLQSQDLPPFPGFRRFAPLYWMRSLVAGLICRVREHMEAWNLMRLMTFAMHFDLMQINWPAIGALAEIWHPHTHTFIFPTFEATILLEEVNLLLGFDPDAPVAYSLENVNPRRVLAEFVEDDSQIRSLLCRKGISLNDLGLWLFRASDRNVESQKLAKGLSILLAGFLLFPDGDGCMEGIHLSTVRSMWSGGSLSHAVLAYLYKGLSSACVGQRFFGSTILLDCWVSMRISLEFGFPPFTHNYSRSPIYSIRDVMGYKQYMVVKTWKLYSRHLWRIFLASIHLQEFNICPEAVFCLGPLKIHPFPNADLQLVGSGELILYSAHRCHVQLGIPRHDIPTPPCVPPIVCTQRGLLEDGMEVRSAICLWGLALYVDHEVMLEEKRKDLKYYTAWIKKLRTRMQDFGDF